MNTFDWEMSIMSSQGTARVAAVLQASLAREWMKKYPELGYFASGMAVLSLQGQRNPCDLAAAHFPWELAPRIPHTDFAARLEDWVGEAAKSGLRSTLPESSLRFFHFSKYNLEYIAPYRKASGSTSRKQTWWQLCVENTCMQNEGFHASS